MSHQAANNQSSCTRKGVAICCAVRNTHMRLRRVEPRQCWPACVCQATTPGFHHSRHTGPSSGGCPQTAAAGWRPPGQAGAPDPAAQETPGPAHRVTVRRHAQGEHKQQHAADPPRGTMQDFKALLSLRDNCCDSTLAYSTQPTQARTTWLCWACQG